jgi:hypothetical protein
VHFPPPASPSAPRRSAATGEFDCRSLSGGHLHMDVASVSICVINFLPSPLSAPILRACAVRAREESNRFRCERRCALLLPLPLPLLRTASTRPTLPLPLPLPAPRLAAAGAVPSLPL